MKRTTAAVFAALFATATAAAASTTSHEATFRFDTASNGGWVSTLNFPETSGVGLTVTSATDSGAVSKVQHWRGHGLGATYRGDTSHTIDAKGDPDNVRLQFSREVRIIGLEFKYVNRWDDFELATFDDGGRHSAGVFDVAHSVDLSSRYLASTGFEIGAYGHSYLWSKSNLHRSSANNCDKLDRHGDWNKFKCFSAFKLKSVTVAYDEDPVAPVPLPAGGLLLASALGAFGLLRRRKKA